MKQKSSLRHRAFRRLTFCPLSARRAESLIETIAAITVIVTGAVAAIVLVRTSLIGNEVIGEKVVALNLGLEAVEAVRNVRDTNYLNFSADADECWNTLDATDVTTCSSASKIEDESTGVTYYLARNFDVSAGALLAWSLEEVASGDSETDGSMSLYTYDLDGTDVPFYAQSGLMDGSSDYTLVDEDAYARTLSFEYDSSGDSVDVTVTVTWDVSGQEKSLTLTRTISNVY